MDNLSNAIVSEGCNFSFLIRARQMTEPFKRRINQDMDT